MVEVPSHVDVSESSSSSVTASEIGGSCLSKLGGSVPIRPERGVHTTMADQLTDKQLEVLRTAYPCGYFS